MTTEQIVAIRCLPTGLEPRQRRLAKVLAGLVASRRTKEWRQRGRLPGGQEDRAGKGLASLPGQALEPDHRLTGSLLNDLAVLVQDHALDLSAQLIQFLAAVDSGGNRQRELAERNAMSLKLQRSAVELLHRRTRAGVFDSHARALGLIHRGPQRPTLIVVVLLHRANPLRRVIAVDAPPLEHDREISLHRVELAERVGGRSLGRKRQGVKTDKTIAHNHVGTLERHVLGGQTPIEAVALRLASRLENALPLVDQIMQERSDLDRRHRLQRRAIFDQAREPLETSAAVRNRIVNELTEVEVQMRLAAALCRPMADVLPNPVRLIVIDLTAEFGVERDHQRALHPTHMTAHETEALALRQPRNIIRPVVVVRKLHFRTSEDDERSMRRLDRSEQLLPRPIDHVEIGRVPGIDGRVPDTRKEEQLTTHGQHDIGQRKAPVGDLIGKRRLAGGEHAEHQRVPLSPRTSEASSQKRPWRPETVRARSASRLLRSRLLRNLRVGTMYAP